MITTGDIASALLARLRKAHGDAVIGQVDVVECEDGESLAVYIYFDADDDFEILTFVPPELFDPNELRTLLMRGTVGRVVLH